MAHRRVRGGRMAVQWQGEAMMRRCSAVPSSYITIANRGGARDSGEVRFCSDFLPPPRFFLFPLSWLDAVWCCATSGGGEWAEG